MHKKHRSLIIWGFISLFGTGIFSAFQQATTKSLPSTSDTIDTSFVNPKLRKSDKLIIRGSLDSAMTEAQEVLSYIKTLPAHPQDSIWWSFTAEGYDRVAQVLKEEGKYEALKDTVEIVINNFENAGLPPNPAIASCYAQLGTAYLNTNRLDLAEQFYQKSFVLRQQLLGKKHVDVAKSLYNLGQIAMKKRQLDTSFDLFNEALAIYDGKAEHLSLIWAVNNALGTLYFQKGELRKALTYFIEGKANCIAINGRVHTDVAKSLNNLGVVYFHLGQFENSLQVWLESVQIKEELFPQGHSDISDTYKNLAILNRRMGKFDDAYDLSKKALDMRILLLGADHQKVADNYTSLGDILISQGKVEQALTYYERAIQIFEKHTAENRSSTILYTYASIGDVYSKKEAYEKAIVYYEKAISIVRENFGENHNLEAGILHNIGLTNELQNKLDLALQDYQESLAIYLRTYDKNHPETAKSYNNIGNILEQQGKWELALENLQKALEIRQNAYGPKHHSVAKTYIHLGDLYHNQKDYDQALSEYQNALIAGTLDFEEKDFSANPPPTARILSTTVMLDILYNKGLTFYKKYLANPASESDLQFSQSTLQTGIQLVENMRKELNWSGSKEVLYQKALPLFETSIRVNKALFEQTNEQSYLASAFDLMEQSKSILLLESIQKSKVNSFHNIPQDLVDLEYDVNTSLAFYEQQIYEEELKGEKQDTQKLSFYTGRRLECKHQYDSILAVYTSDYPDYFQLRHSPTTTSSSEWQQSLLDDQTAILEYFVGDSSTYVMVVSREDMQLIELGDTRTLIDLVEQFRQSVFSYHLSGQRSEASYQQSAEDFVQSAQQLYQHLIHPIQKVSSLPFQLVIVPDGILGYLPFELLLKEKPSSPIQFSSHSYLLKHHQISYCYSATLLKEMQEKSQSEATQTGVLAFAPSFPPTPESQALVANNRSGLGSLPYNEPEVKGILEAYDGNLFTAAAATKSAFLAQAPNYRLIHLATHGKANDQQEDFSFLAFSPDSAEHFLYTRELYNMNLTADMVVLSACETGLGKLKKGEGIVSLARGFSYAGAKSIVTTFWSINDQASSTLMIQFYKHLKDGMTKDAALRQAKLDYLDTHPNEETHPFYWGAFIAIGDMSPIPPPGNKLWWWWFLPFGFVFSYFAYKKSKNKPLIIN